MLNIELSEPSVSAEMLNTIGSDTQYFCVYSNYGRTRDYAMNVQTTKYCNECMEAFLLSQQHWKNTSYVTNLRELIESFHNSRLPL